MIRAGYSALGIAITPLLRRWLQRRAARGKEDAARLGERFGHASVARPPGTLLWLHAASVGETQSVLTLLRALLERHPEAHALVTTGTVTSAALMAQQALPRTIHQFVPVDTRPAVRRFLDHWRPDLALWVESEFWPQLLWQARGRGIPLLLINARLSARSVASWRRWPRTIAGLLNGFAAIYAGSAEDAVRLTRLGAAGVRDAGNLKYDAAPLPVDSALLAELQRTTQGRELWLAASTHANEEQQVAEVHRALSASHPTLLTLLVPRHAARGDAVAADLRARGFAVAQRSKSEPIAAETQLYLADTMGELGSFYSLSPIVFLGGSLIAHGGHNPLEPARLHCAILTGPHTHNFAAILQQMEQVGAVRAVHDRQELTAVLDHLLRDTAQQNTLAANAARAMGNAGGASAAILQQCDALLKAHP